MYHELTIRISAEEFAQLEALSRDDAAAERQSGRETYITPASTAAAIVGMYLRERMRSERLALAERRRG